MNSYLLSELTRGRGKDVVRNQGDRTIRMGRSGQPAIDSSLIYRHGSGNGQRCRKFICHRLYFNKRYGRISPATIARNVNLESDGNITAEYTTDEMQLGEQKFSEINMDDPESMQQVSMFIMMKLMFNTLSAEDIAAATSGTRLCSLPRGLAHW